PTYVHALSLHDALPIYGPETTEVRAMAWRESMRYELDEQELKDFYLGISKSGLPGDPRVLRFREEVESDVLYIPEDFFGKGMLADRKSTRLNSSHVSIS